MACASPSRAAALTWSPASPGLACGHAQAGVQHRYRLGCAAGHVVVGPGDSRAHGPDTGPLGVDLAWGRERVPFLVPRDRGCLGRGLVLVVLAGGVLNDPLPARTHALLVEPLGDLGLHRPRDTQGSAAAALPGPRRIAGPGVVRHGTRASGRVAAGDVGDVVAGFHVGLNGHGGPPCGYGARRDGHGHRVMHRYSALQARGTVYPQPTASAWLRIRPRSAPRTSCLAGQCMSVVLLRQSGRSFAEQQGGGPRHAWLAMFGAAKQFRAER